MKLDDALDAAWEEWGIERLTPEQKAKIPEWKEKWLAIGLSCEPCDVTAAKLAARRAYGAAGLDPPELFLVMDSPVSGAIAAAALKNHLGAQVSAQVRDQVWDQVRDQVWDQVRDQVWDQVRDRVRDQVRDQVWDQVGAQVWDQVGAQVWDWFGDQIYGSHDAGWLCFYDFFRSVVGLRCTDRLRGLIDLARSCGWWAPYGGVAIFQHRHCELHRDERGSLHHPSRAAVLYRDGFTVHAWHGVRVPAHVIERPEKITPPMIEKQENAEIRRVMIERYGFDRYLRDGGFTTKHEDDWGTLYRKEVPNEPAIQLVKVVNATPEPDGRYKDYVLPVASTVSTAHEAVASTFGLEPSTYHPEKET